MSKRSLGYWFVFIIIGSFLFSCKVRKNENIKLKIKPRSSKFLIKNLKEKEFYFNTITAKSAITLIDSLGKKTSFKSHFRIRKDSAIWMSITPLLGIEMARILITEDSVKFINRANKEYFIGDFGYINQLFGTNLDYQMLEALLIGNSLDFEENDKVHSRVDRKKGFYYLSTEKKRKVFKELKKEKDKIRGEAQVIWLDPLTFKIKELLLSSPETNRSLLGVYSDYRELEKQLLPYSLKFRLNSKTASNMDIEYIKFSIDKPVSFSFKISSKYEEIKK